MSARKVTVEPAGKSEADWSSGLASSAGLPDFVEGEFSHLVELAEGGEASQADLGGLEPIAAERPLGAGYWEGKEAPSEQERVTVLSAQMEELLRVAGMHRDEAKYGLGGLISRFADRWGDD
jgi:hypothetical protein